MEVEEEAAAKEAGGQVYAKFLQEKALKQKKMNRRNRRESNG
jgi:hypothetical protein